jgi:hypothetical protein
MESTALFPTLLGPAFGALPVAVRAVHDGHSLTLRGTATVTQGTSLLSRLLAHAASLPPAQDAAPLEVRIDAQPQQEVWTRRYGEAHVMRSALRRHGREFTESLGLATLHFSLHGSERGIAWQLTQVRALGVPLPLRWFDVQATATAPQGRYRFTVQAALRGIGLIVRYEGELDVIG